MAEQLWEKFCYCQGQVQQWVATEPDIEILSYEA